MRSAYLVPTILWPFSVPVMFLARATPLVATSAAAITASNSSSAVLLTVHPPSCGRDLSVPRPQLSLRMQHAPPPTRAHQPLREADGYFLNPGSLEHAEHPTEYVAQCNCHGGFDDNGHLIEVSLERD